jgi:hypothetical protein
MPEVCTVAPNATTADAARLLRAPRPEPGAEKIGAFDRAVGERAVQMLLDDVVLTVLDTLEAKRDVQPVSDLLRLRLDELELRRIGVPPGDQRRGLQRAVPFPQARRQQRPELRVGSEARGDRVDILRRDGLYEPCPDSLRHRPECRPSCESTLAE